MISINLFLSSYFCVSRFFLPLFIKNFFAVYRNYNSCQSIRHHFSGVGIALEYGRNKHVRVDNCIYCHRLPAFAIRADFCIDFVKRHILNSCFFRFFLKFPKCFFSFFKRNRLAYFHCKRNSALLHGLFQENSECCRQVKSELLENLRRFVFQIFVYAYLHQCACHCVPPQICVVNSNICVCNVFVNKNICNFLIWERSNE